MPVSAKHPLSSAWGFTEHSKPTSVADKSLTFIFPAVSVLSCVLICACWSQIRLYLPVSKSVCCEASDNIASLIEQWFCWGTGSPSCHINLTPCVPLGAESTLSPRSEFMSRPGSSTLYFALLTRTSAMGQQVWFGLSGQWPHRFNHSARCNFHVRQLHREKK